MRVGAHTCTEARVLNAARPEEQHCKLCRRSSRAEATKAEGCHRGLLSASTSGVARRAATAHATTARTQVHQKYHLRHERAQAPVITTHAIATLKPACKNERRARSCMQSPMAPTLACMLPSDQVLALPAKLQELIEKMPGPRRSRHGSAKHFS